MLQGQKQAHGKLILKALTDQLSSEHNYGYFNVWCYTKTYMGPGASRRDGTRAVTPALGSEALFMHLM